MPERKQIASTRSQFPLYYKTQKPRSRIRVTIGCVKELVVGCLFLLILMVSSIGCGKARTLNVEYGKVHGMRGSGSLNGVSVLADMFEARGQRVKTRRRISPRINRFDTLVWFPDRDSCPSPESIAALNEWLSKGYLRTLIFVGRDYDCELDYLSEVIASAPLEQKEEMLRRLAEARLDQNLKGQQFDFWMNQKLSECEWFEQVSFPRQKTGNLTGPFIADISVAGMSLDESRETLHSKIEFSTLLTPRSGKDQTVWDAESLIDVDDHPFAFSLTNRIDRYDSYGDSNENKIIVVSNGSFLLNHALLDSANCLVMVFASSEQFPNRIHMVAEI